MSVQKPAREPVIVVDTREQKPYRFTRCQVKTLPTGDYSLVGLEDCIAIERKSAADLAGSLGTGRARFRRELERLAQLDYAAIVVEASLKQLLQPPPFSRMHPKAGTGLSYALVEHQQKGWQVKIGRYPANSRKLLIVDEAQHLPDWDVRTLAKAMEEGFLQVDRVQSKGYESQTRLILIANPKKDRIMDTFAFGCEALKTLFPPMILRRIDLAVFANTSDLQDLSFASPPVTGDTPRQVTPEGLRAVIYWAWTLTPQQIRFAPAAERHCLQRAEALARVYGLAGDIPLVPPSDVRNKLARLAAAFAVFQVSASDDFSRLHIEPEHVDLAATFLDTIYTHENCGLDQYSALKGRATQLRDYEQIAQAFLKKRHDEERVNGSATGFFSQLIYALRATDVIRRDELVEQLDCGLETVKRGVQLLKRFNLLDSTKDGYVKKPKFNRFLRRFLAAQPDFLKGLDRELPEPQAQVEAQVALSVNPGEAQVEAQVPTHAETIS